MTSTTADISNNPLLQQDGLPKFESIEAEHITPAIEILLEKMKNEFNQLEQDAKNGIAISYDDIIPKLEIIQFPIEYVWGICAHLNGVKNTDELRIAYEKNQPLIIEATTAISQSKPIYDTLVKIHIPEDDENSFINKQKCRAVELALRQMTLGGVGLVGEQKERFNVIKQRLASLKTSFSNHVLDATKAYSLTIDDASKLVGVPESAKTMWANAHIQYLKSKEEENSQVMDVEKGPWRITLDMPSYIAVQSHIQDRTIREDVYKAFITRASVGEIDNVPIIYETLQLKQEMAELLGFTNYAEQSLASKMAPSINDVRNLAELIRIKALPAAIKELEEITALAKENGGDEYATLDKLEPWDVKFWTERLKESKFELTEEETRPYFALPAVLDGMFTLVKRIFNIEVKAADGEAEIWHPDVRFFNVYDIDTDTHIASFYLDPYSRPENKRGGAWMATCIGKSDACKRNVAVAYLTCNGSPPVGDKPSLMTFREVETLFHEFGHGLQHMLTRATVGDVAGINGIEWDAVELPSQFMENWCYDKSTIYGFAKHWETNISMPIEMFNKLKEQKTFNSAMMMCRQLLFGELDMELHSNYNAITGVTGETESIFDVQRRVSEKITPYAMPIPEDRFLCSFSHIFAGGYAAGYYSYKWAEVMSADAFSAFEDVGLDNEDEIQRVGRKFRNTVLSYGGGIDPMTVFKEFRGREPSPDALLRHNGLA